MSKISLIFPSVFFSLNFSIMVFNNHSLLSSFSDSFYNTCAYIVMALFIKYNLELFYDPEEDKEVYQYNNEENVEITATEKIMRKADMNNAIINDVNKIIMR